MPKVSEQYWEAKQQQIVDAAITCFAAKGFDATTIQDICQEAGVSHGAVYRYFQSKEEIVEASFRREMEERLARYSAVMHQEDARRTLEDWVAVYFRRRTEPEAETVMKFRMQLYGESVRNRRMGEIQRQGRDEMLTGLAEVIRTAQDKGEISAHVDPLAVARIVAAVSDGLYVQRSVSPNLDVSKCREAAKAIFFGDLWVTQKKEGDDGGNSR